MHHSKHSLASAVCAAMLCAPAISVADIEWNGFLTAAGGMSSPDEGDSLAGYEEDLTFNQDTKLGLQLRAPISDKLSATGQIVARGSEDYEVDMAWAYLSYQASDSTALRMGRFRTPFYLYSDYLEVGYAYHWISPPADVYSLPADSIDGVDVVYQAPLGSVDVSAQIYAGSINSDFVQGGQEIDTRIRNQAGLALTFTYDWLTFRASHHEAQKVSFGGLENVYLAPEIGTIGDLQTTLNGLSLLTGDPGYAEAAGNLVVDEVKFTFDELALKVEWNNLLLVGEMTQLKADSGPVDTQNRMFVTAGYTFGSVMLHVTQTRAEDDVADIASTIPTDIPGLEATSMALAGAVNAIAEDFATPDRTTNTLGLRWDFEAGAAAKIEFSDISDTTGTDGTLLRFGIDMVF